MIKHISITILFLLASYFSIFFYTKKDSPSVFSIDIEDSVALSTITDDNDLSSKSGYVDEDKTITQFTYAADIEDGLIGTNLQYPVEDPADDIFHIYLPENSLTEYTAYLEYHLFGLTNYDCLSYSINDAQSTGGRFVKKNEAWSFQKEAISTSVLRAGDNVIRFTIPFNASYFYKIKQLNIVLEKREKFDADILINQPDYYYYGTTAYLKGIIQYPKGEESTPVKLFCNNVPVEVYNNAFEIIIDSLSNEYHSQKIEIKAIFTKDRIVTKYVDFTTPQNSYSEYSPESAKGIAVASFYFPTDKFHLDMAEFNMSAAITIDSNSLHESKFISITALRNSDVPALNSDLVNVTKGAAGFRFLPHGSHFSVPAIVTMPYDSTLIPQGYSAADIRTYYFDEKLKLWIDLPYDSLIEKNGIVRSSTTHFTDMINGIIKVPESPQTQGYTPTTIKDFKAAEPASGITMIAPPSANNMGSASLNFPLKFPKGREEMEPQLAIQYTNEAENGWLGLGWNITTPFISIETRWGVPRYNAELETETYALNNSQLAPITYRTDFIPRTSEKRFYPRVQNAFDKIIRHGNSPAAYWWEVVNKNGARNFYGGNPETGVVANAVLKDDHGNIGQWAITETRDLNNNSVKYFYEEVRDFGIINGSVLGKQLYIKHIIYTGNNNIAGPYKIEFIRDRELNGQKRKDIQINCRLGFKVVTADLLRKINIRFNDQLIRSYELIYKQGAFYKTLLKSIAELDDAGTVFYSHEFEYNDDVNSISGYSPLAPKEDWNPGYDDIKGDIINPVPGFTGEGSALSTSKSNTRNGGLAVTIGSVSGGLWSKLESVGGNFGFSADDQEGLVSMVDITGDGLPDKIFKKNGALYYRTNNGNKSHQFGEARFIKGIDNFNTSNSKNLSWGLEAIGSVGTFGYTKTNTTVNTNTFFDDFNGDGLVDIAANNLVYFNRLNPAGDPEFFTSSSGTPSLVFQSNTIDRSFFAPDMGKQKEQEEQFPLQDIIRLWEAPFDGRVKISSPVQLQSVSPQIGINVEKEDGVRVSIQLADRVIWNDIIPAKDFSVKTPIGIHDIAVVKGQRIYFRVQSIYNGYDDIVKWDPVIEYLTPVTPLINADNKKSDYYKASEDFILESSGRVGIPKDGTIKIDGTFIKEITSDTVTLLITKENAGVSNIVSKKVFTTNEVFNNNISAINLDVKLSDTLFFLLQSDSHINRAVVEWRPHYEYIAFTDNTPVTNSLGKPTIETDISPANTNFNDWIRKSEMLSTDIHQTVKIKPCFSIDIPNATGSMLLTVKGKNTIYGKQIVELNNGKVSNLVTIKDISLIQEPTDTIFCEYTTDNRSLALLLLNPQVLTEIEKIIYVNGEPKLITETDCKNAGLYTNPEQNFLGPLYRGWGHFSFKGDITNTPLDEAKLNLDELKNYDTDPDKFMDSSNFKNINDPSKANFMSLYVEPQKQQWRGYDSSVFISREFMGSSRLWLHDVSVDSILIGGSVTAVSKINTTSSTNYSFGLSGVISANTGYGSAETVINLDMADMNGDRYPDVLNETNIQYTLPIGGLEKNIYSQVVGATQSTGVSNGFTLGPGGGGGSYAVSTNTKYASSSSVHSESVAKSGLGFSLGGISWNNNTDDAVSSWLDMNGDGLQDKIYSNGSVALNIGYGFLPPEDWHFTKIDQNTSNSVNSGAGVNLVSGSIQAGFNLSRSSSNNSTSFADVNGDGLVDKCTYEPEGIQVQLNTGNGFGSSISWKDFNILSSNISTGEALNGAFTIGIPIFFIKVCINPSIGSGHGVSRRQDQIMDIDGDGFPDVLHSENDGNLSVKRSTIGKTNLLTKVIRPMGGYFTLDYERMGNSYNMPQSKWVLKSVEVFDGLSGDGADISRNEFTYDSGFYNRHERDFYGFGTVTTKQINTLSDNSIYRKKIQKFSNSTYYKKGLEESNWVENVAGNKYEQINNFYDSRKQIDSVYFPALVKTEKLFYEGKDIPGLKTYSEFEYDLYGNIITIKDVGDGSEQDITMATIEYHDNENLYIKSIPASIKVSTVEGIKRERSTLIDNTGDIIQIKQFLQNGVSATYDMEYDPYGNLSKITRPSNDSGQRMWYSYEYDNDVHSFITKVTDAYGYSSSTVYDYRFGIPLETISLNDEKIRYVLDNQGRIKTVTGPYELAAGKPYTIAFEYHPEAVVPFSVTRHYDPEYDGDIKIITFSDGLTRTVQIKKQASVFSGKGEADDEDLIISGRVIYDAFGRASKNYYPTKEILGSNDLTFTNTFGAIASTSEYDVLDRTVKNVLADGATTSTTFGIADGLFTTLSTDPLNNTSETLTDVKERKRISKIYGGPNGIITTKFYYNALSELMRVVDNNGNETIHTYDNLGRKTSVLHPDAGLTVLIYDPAGNLLKKNTPQIRKEIPNGGAIQYRYQYERVTDIDYPRFYQNKVKYTYGGPKTGAKTGRLILQEDASGGQEFFYGRLGEVTKTIRTILVSPILATTYVSEQEYDTWNRIKKMVYPDGEVVTFHYNRGGSLRSMDGYKLGNTYTYVDQLSYDEFEQRAYLKYGNGTETFYSYDSKRRRLDTLKSFTSLQKPIMNNTYGYDAVNNILSIVNDVKADTGKLGGYAKQEFFYDNLYRLDSANGSYFGYVDTSGYALRMTYDNLYNITKKSLTDSTPGNTYALNYTYGSITPHQPTQIDTDNYKYDSNGNNLGNGISENFWDEENRLMAVLNNGVVNMYTYDAGGERALKSNAGIQGIWLNGAPAGMVRHDENYTAYISPFLVCRKASFTKHYYIEDQRITSKIGIGTFTNTNFPQSAITAGGINYTKRAEQIEKNRKDYYASLGISPGPPLDKNFYGRPENSGITSPVYVDTTASDVPRGWPGNTTSPADGGPTVFVDSIPSRDSVKAGYGYSGTGHEYEKQLFFFHPDHLGSTNYVTNVLGEVNQHAEYSPFGETFFEEHSSSFSTPYLFNAKERDVETGLYYYGARYYNPRVGQWISVDPMADKFPGVSPYNYCFNNPVKLVDPDGNTPLVVIGAVAGGLISGSIEAISQYRNPNATKSEAFKAIGGAIVHGAVTGAVAGLTGGASLLETAAISAGANVIGGALDNAIQGKEISTKSVIKDAVIGGAIGAVTFGAGKLLNNVASEGGTGATAKSGKSFFDGTKYSDKVKAQMKNGDFHSFHESVTAFENSGTISTIKGGDKITREMLKIPGEYGGKKGFFEFIKEADGTINHRFFRPLIKE